MKRVSRSFLLVLTSLLLVVLSACEPSVPLVGQGQANTGDVINDQTNHQQITLKLWHTWATDSDSNRRPFEKALTDWNNAHPELQIVAESTESETYKSKLRTAIAVNEVPDIFFSWGAGFARPFVESGKILALDDYLNDEIKAKIEPGSFDNFTYGGKTYALPTYLVAGIFYCNDQLFTKYNVKIPETYNELLEAIRVFNEYHVTPMAVGLKDGWPGIFHQNILAIRTAGIEKCNAALSGQVSFYQPEFIESAQKLVDLIDAGAFDIRSLQLTQHEAEAGFIEGRIPMYYSGSWGAGSMDREDSNVRGHVVIKNFPVIEEAKGDANGFLGGAIDGFMISSQTLYKEEAVSTLVTLCENFAKESYISGSGIPAWKVDVTGENVSPLAQEISKLLESRDGFVLAWDTFLGGTAAQTHIGLVSNLYTKTITPENFAMEMQKLNRN